MIADLDQRFHTWLESEYHRSPHRSLKGTTPLETWLAKCHLIVPLDPTGDLAVAFRHQATRKVYRDSTVTLDGVLFELPSTLIGAHLSRDRGGIVVARPGAARHRAVVRPGHRTRVAVPPHEPVTNAAPQSFLSRIRQWPRPPTACAQKCSRLSLTLHGACLHDRI